MANGVGAAPSDGAFARHPTRTGRLLTLDISANTAAELLQPPEHNYYLRLLAKLMSQREWQPLFSKHPLRASAILVTFITNILPHTNFRWDLWLRDKMPWSEPLWWIVERIITLPDTHHAHHAYFICATQ